MRAGQPTFPTGQPTQFRSTVHGTVFAGRERHLERMSDGDLLRLIPDPPVSDDGEVWVHLPTGEPVGHLPPEISWWLLPWLRGGGFAEAKAVRVRGADTPSWRRLLLEVYCHT